MRRLGITVFPDVVNALILTSIVRRYARRTFQPDQLKALHCSFPLVTATFSAHLAHCTPSLLPVKLQLS